MLTKLCDLIDQFERDLKVSFFLDESEGEAIPSLSVGEKALLQRWALPKKREEWLRGREAIQLVLAKMGHDQDTSVLQFPNPQVSMSHSQNRAIAAGVKDRSIVGIGIDIEDRETIHPKSIRFFLTPNEILRLHSSENNFDSSDQTPSASFLLRLWTIKEALFKADPENHGGFLSDYELETPFTMAGKAKSLRNSKITLFYSCQIYRRKPISLAIARKRFS